jgi:hypothetical protein
MEFEEALSFCEKGYKTRLILIYVLNLLFNYQELTNLIEDESVVIELKDKLKDTKKNRKR